MDPATYTKVVAMVACWALLVTSWGVCYSMLKLRWLRSTFTMRRWNANPFQMYNLLLLLQVSINQVIIGVPDNSAQTVLPREAQIALAVCNMIGASIAAYALHLRDKETALWIELSAYAALAGSLGIYVVLVLMVFPMPNTSFGLALSEAFVFASLHRSIWIFWYKNALHKGQLAQARLLLRKIENNGGDL